MHTKGIMSRHFVGEVGLRASSILTEDTFPTASSITHDVSNNFVSESIPQFCHDRFQNKRHLA